MTVLHQYIIYSMITKVNLVLSPLPYTVLSSMTHPNGKSFMNFSRITMETETKSVKLMAIMKLVSILSYFSLSMLLSVFFC